jgi:predicted amidohydrolase YtcJ
VAVKNGRIVFVGKTSMAQDYVGAATEVIDLQGKTVVPGFVDTHNHLSDHPEALYWLTTRPFTTMEQIGAALREYRSKDPAMKQIRTIGWNPEMLRKLTATTGNTPAQLIDAFVSDIPVILLHDWHHDMWVNSAALKNANIDGTTPNPPGAFIERIAGTTGYGKPNGIIREFGAQNLIEKALPFPEFTKEQFKTVILDWQRLAAVRGVTSALVPQPRPTVNFFEALQELDAAAHLSMRYDVAVWANEIRGTEQIPEILATKEKYKGKLFKIDTVKVFGTGSSAWSPSNALVWDQTVLNSTVAGLDKAGMRVYVHDIGNASSYDAMLDALAFAQKQNGSRDARHTITHVSAAANPAIPRFKQLNVRADGHPVPKSFFDGGVNVTFSSDYPVREFFPTTRLGAAVNGGWTVADALAAHTIAGAELMFLEKEVGSLEVGKSADLVVFDQSFTGKTGAQISAMRPVMTVSIGKVVYRAPSMGASAVPAAQAAAVAVIGGEQSHKH